MSQYTGRSGSGGASGVSQSSIPAHERASLTARRSRESISQSARATPSGGASHSVASKHAARGARKPVASTAGAGAPIASLTTLRGSVATMACATTAYSSQRVVWRSISRPRDIYALR